MKFPLFTFQKRVRSLLGEISGEIPVTYVGTGISLEISPGDSKQQLTLSLCLGNKVVKYQFLNKNILEYA